MSKHIISVHLKPYKASLEEAQLIQVIAFTEGDKYYLAGFEQIIEELKSLLPEIEDNYYKPILISLEIRTGTEEEVEMFTDFLSRIKVSPLEEE